MRLFQKKEKEVSESSDNNYKYNDETSIDNLQNLATEITTTGTKSFMWATEFAKIVVVLTFVVFIVVAIYAIVAISITYFQTGELDYLDTLIDRAFNSVDSVVMTYLIKAGAENISKGVGTIVDKVLDYKATISDTGNTVIFGASNQTANKASSDIDSTTGEESDLEPETTDFSESDDPQINNNASDEEDMLDIK